MSGPKERKISNIREGTVIDHVPADQTNKVARILDLEKHDDVVTIATNLKSKKLGKKGIIKIGNKFLTKKDYDRIALVAPTAQVSIIRDYQVEKKDNVEVPEEMHNIVQCINPNCITNNASIRSNFKTIKKDPLKIKCHYCERTMTRGEIVIK